MDHTTDQQTPASVEVEVNGTYQVTVLPISEGLGIIGSSVEYIEQIFVSVNTFEENATTADTSIPTTGMF